MWWKETGPTLKKKAVAYYRHSAQDKQENSIPIQREQVHQFASEHSIEIMKEFADHGKSGLSIEGRAGFNEMIQDYVVGNKEDFDYILVLDVSRWGRFLDTDISAYYTGLCGLYGKQVIFTTIGFPKEGDPIYQLHLTFERYRSANFLRELSAKVSRGSMKIAEQGFWAGGMPHYGFSRLLLDEQRNPVQVLQRGERKSIQNQRVVLKPGDAKEVATVKMIFRSFIRNKGTCKEIAVALNKDNISSPGEKKWTSSSVRSVLRTELYTGTMVYNKTFQKLKSPRKQNPQEDWIRKEQAFEPIIDEKTFLKAQEILKAREEAIRRKFSDEDMLLKLTGLNDRYGTVRTSLISADRHMVSPHTYAKHFQSLDGAYQNMFKDVIEQKKEYILDEIRSKSRQVETCEDFLVVDELFSVNVQPCVPIPHGCEAYWSFHPDHRNVVDLTLGVPLSNGGNYDILGYFAFPRLLVPNRQIRIFSKRADRLDLHRYTNLQIIDDLLGLEAPA